MGSADFPSNGLVVYAPRALGRVAAHEIVHAFATLVGETRHRGNGLMAGALAAEALLRPRLALDDRSAEALVRGLRRARDGGSSIAGMASVGALKALPAPRRDARSTSASPVRAANPTR